MVKGFQLVAITEKGAITIRKFNIEDKKLKYIKVVSTAPFILEFMFKRRFQMILRKDSIEFFIQKTFNVEGLCWGVDDEVKIL